MAPGLREERWQSGDRPGGGAEEIPPEGWDCRGFPLPLRTPPPTRGEEREAREFFPEGLSQFALDWLCLFPRGRTLQGLSANSCPMGPCDTLCAASGPGPPSSTLLGKAQSLSVALNPAHVSESPPLLSLSQSTRPSRRTLLHSEYSTNTDRIIG